MSERVVRVAPWQDVRDDRCVDCGSYPPLTNTRYTLFGPEFGWRLTRRKIATDVYVVDLHCPRCWTHSRRTGP